MNIMFTGYKNAIAASFINIDTKTNEREVVHALSCQLTNDNYGQDLTKYLKECGTSEGKPHPFDANYINITTLDGDEFNSPKIYLNGEELEVNDNNLGIFSFCAKFLKNVMPKIKNQLTDGYYRSDDFNKHIFMNSDLKKVMSKEEYDKFVPDIIKDEVIQSHANIIFDKIQGVMEDYFA